MKKTYQRLPESELDIMLVLWNNTPPMTRPEIEKVITMKKKLASTTILSLLTRLENKNFVEVTKQGKMNLYTPLVSQSDYQAHESQSVLEKLYGNSLKKFVTSLYHGKKISSEEVQGGIANYGGFHSTHSETECYCSSSNFTGKSACDSV